MRELLRVLVLIAAVLIVAVGTMLGVAGIALGILSGGEDVVVTVTLSASVLALSLSFGLASALQAWRAIKGLSSATFYPRMPWLLLVLFLLALALGQLVLSLSILPVLTFPLLHIAASVLPALFIVALIGRAVREVSSWRDMVLQTSGGVFLAAPLAFILEVIGILFIGAAAFTGLALRPDSQELLVTVSSYLQDPAGLQDPSASVPALLTPVAIVAGLTLVAGLIPLVEEVIKTIGVGLATYRQPSLAQALLWGLAAGAGFSIAEGLLGSAGGLDAWLPTILLRIGTTLLHCLTGALMGLAWYQLIAGRRWARGLGLYLLSVSLHGLWNGLAATMALLSVTALGPGVDAGGQLAHSLGTLATLLLLAILALGSAGGLAGLAAYARRHAPPPARPTGVQAEPSVLAIGDRTKPASEA